jgi:hypothetical protein
VEFTTLCKKVVNFYNPEKQPFSSELSLYNPSGLTVLGHKGVKDNKEADK